MRSRFVLVWAAASLGVAISAYAQSPAFTLRDALAEARRANPELIALQHQAESVRAAVPASRYLDAPMFETQIWGWPVTTLNPANTDMYMFMGEQMLPGKGKRAARERVASETAHLSESLIAVRANAI